MRFEKRFISLFMVFVFVVLSLKVLFSGAMGHGSCDEFGHLHFYKAHLATQNINSIYKVSNQQDGDDENCHEGKFVFAYVTLISDTYSFLLPHYDLVFERFFSFENHFESPYLEPQRKPPKYS